MKLFQHFKHVGPIRLHILVLLALIVVFGGQLLILFYKRSLISTSLENSYPPIIIVNDTDDDHDSQQLLHFWDSIALNNEPLREKRLFQFPSSFSSRQSTTTSILSDTNQHYLLKTRDFNVVSDKLESPDGATFFLIETEQQFLAESYSNELSKCFNHSALSFAHDNRFDSKTMRRELTALLDSLTRLENVWTLAFGTALGQARQHGFIEWDNDADIMILQSDLSTMIDALRGERVRLATNFVAIATLSVVNPLLFVHKRFGFYVDVFSVSQHYDRLQLGHIPGRERLTFDADTILPPQQCRFENKTLPCVNDRARYLETIYGPTWFAPHQF
jgi:hypothetical protein